MLSFSFVMITIPKGWQTWEIDLLCYDSFVPIILHRNLWLIDLLVFSCPNQHLETFLEPNFRNFPESYQNLNWNFQFLMVQLNTVLAKIIFATFQTSNRHPPSGRKHFSSSSSSPSTAATAETEKSRKRKDIITQYWLSHQEGIQPDARLVLKCCLPRGCNRKQSNTQRLSHYSCFQCVHHRHLCEWIDEYNYRSETQSFSVPIKS